MLGRDLFARGLGSDPLGLMCLYAAWLRLEDGQRKGFAERYKVSRGGHRSVDGDW